jgi:hypothetical protein
MSTIVTRSGKGSPLTHNEVDTNFTNLNTDKVEKTSADITGGTINGTTIGATTPATGVFTTLTATGQTSLGGVAGAEGLRVTTTASSVNWLQVQGSATGNGPRLVAQGTDGDVRINYLTKGSGAHVFATDANAGTVQFNITRTASAVNYVQVTGAATNGRPSISAQGSDTNVGLNLSAKGNRAILFYGRDFGGIQFGTGVISSAVNYFLASGAITGNSPTLQADGSDTNISQVFQSKGTGAIDLAAGSSGVNISNGGTVTAITRTAAGSGYTSFPSLAISAPTTASGVQATATVGSMITQNPTTVQSGGTGYTAGDVLTIVGGTPVSVAATYTVATVSGGVITSVNPTNFAQYSVLPANPVSVTGGTGSSATLNLTYGVGTSAYTITNAGSGYVEQPTVSFSGGGGSGAAAFAIVGSQSIIKGIGTSSGTISNQSVMFQTPSGNSLLLRDPNQATPDAHLMMQATASGYGILVAEGSNANASLFVGAKGSGSVRFSTSGTTLTEQMRVAHTASAVNYVQVTGAATGSGPIISTVGSDTNVGLAFRSKGSGFISFGQDSTNQFEIIRTASAVNRLRVTGSTAGNAPIMSAEGTDTNIDLSLTPKGTGNVRFGTFTDTILTPTGYVEIKDSGGTVRRLLVG